MTLQIAFTLARRGYYVHPPVECDKQPILPHGSNDATLNEALLRTWWTEPPEAKVGVSPI